MQTAGNQNNSPLLRFAAVSTEPDPAYDVPLWNIDFSLDGGELLLIRLERGQLRLPLADAAVGLIQPIEGQVNFRGQNWQVMGPDRAAAERGKCGRVFAGRGWCSTLSLNHNITLAQRHHTSRPEQNIESEAVNLAHFFGLPGLPLWPPGRTRPGDLGRAGLIRAFLGKPELIVLEQPTRHLFPEIMPPLMNAIRAARDRGAAVVLLTDEPGVWDEAALRPTLRGTMFGSRMQLARQED